MLGLKATMSVSRSADAALMNISSAGIKRTAHTLHSRHVSPNLPAQVIDNSGALVAECVNVLKNKSNHGLARIGACLAISSLT